MSSEIAMMRVKLSASRKERSELRMRLISLSESIVPRINPMLVDEPEEMEVAEAATLMDTMVMVQAELLTVGSKIKRLEKSLGE